MKKSQEENQILFKQLLDFSKQIETKYEKEMQKIKLEAERSKQYLEKETVKRIHLNNELIEERGNIRVHLRIRPVENEEDSIIQDVTDDTLVLKNSKKFEFDKIYPLKSSQKEVFNDVKPLLKHFVHCGTNVMLMTFGETSSGKTYSMEGTKSDPGIIPLSLLKLEEDLKNEKYQISISILEIYFERVKDLFNQKLYDHTIGKEQLTTKITKKKENDFSKVKNIIFEALKNRSTACTKMNSVSSRSHCIITLELSHENVKRNLTFVDLAGSENVEMSEVTGSNLREASFVNKSLSALQDVILSLSQKKSFIPYRSSRLTQMLQGSFYNSRVLMLIHISSMSKCISETQHTLKFGQTSREIRTKNL